MFKEKLMTALNDAINNFNGGADENESVVKAASAHGFNPDQTQRLVESFNTAKTICFYKNAEDRSKPFPTADPDAVIAKLFGKVEEEKAAAPVDDYEDYSYYEQDHPELKKSAGLPDDYDPWAGFGDAEFKDPEAEARVKVAEYNGLRDAAKACENVVLISGNHYDMTIEKVAGAISRERYHDEEIVDELFTYGKSLGKMAEEAVTAVLERVPGVTRELKDLRISTFDHKYPMLASSIKSAAEALQETGTHVAQAEQLHKMAEEMADELHLRDVEVEEREEMDEFIPKSAAGGIYGEALGNLASSAGKEVTKGIVDTGKLALGDQGVQKKYNERAKNTYRSMLLQRLMLTDPILKGADEEAVVRAYETLTELAPEVSLKEDVTRSILREAVTTTSLSPYDAKAFVDLDSAIKKQLTAQPAPEAKK